MIYSSINKISLKKMLALFTDNSHPIRFRAHGSSMYPFIKNGSLITITPYICPIKPQKGDIVLIFNALKNQLFAHRIVHISNKGFFVKGDNNSSPDGLFKKKQVLGYVTEIEDPVRNIILKIPLLNKMVALFSRISLLNYFKPIISIIQRIKRVYGQQIC